MSLDGSSVEFSKMVPIFTPKYTNDHKIVNLFTLWPYSTVMHGFYVDIVALKNALCQKMNLDLISSKLFILWPCPDFQFETDGHLGKLKGTAIQGRFQKKIFFTLLDSTDRQFCKRPCAFTLYLPKNKSLFPLLTFQKLKSSS